MAAILHWGGLPPCGEPNIINGDPQGLLKGVVQNGGDAAAGAYIAGDPAHGIPDCSIVWAPGSVDPGETCALLVHEWGHLFGHEHTADPDDTMYWAGLDFVHEWSCRRVMARHRHAPSCVRKRDKDNIGYHVCSEIWGWTLRRPFAQQVPGRGR